MKLINLIFKGIYTLQGEEREEWLLAGKEQSSYLDNNSQICISCLQNLILEKQFKSMELNKGKNGEQRIPFTYL